MLGALRFVLIFLIVFASLIGGYAVLTGNLPPFFGKTLPVEDTGERVEDREPALSDDDGLRSAVDAATEWDGDPGGRKVLQAINQERTQLVREVMPSVVSITTARVLEEVDRIRTMEDLLRASYPGGRSRLGVGYGSGAIISEDGLIITSHHVIDGNPTVIVRLADNRQFTADVIASDEQTDIALLKVDATGLIPLQIGNSDLVEVGESVCAVGNPYGLAGTVSWGYISAIGRKDLAEQEYLQHDAILHSGFSGGPLVNVKGELIGLNRSIVQFDRAAGWAGIALASPANTVRGTLHEMFRSLPEGCPFLGVRFFPGKLPQSVRLAKHLGETPGLLIERVYPNSPASEVHLQSQDFLTHVNGVPVSSVDRLMETLQGMPAGARVTIEVIRSGLRYSPTITLHEPVSLESVPGIN